jgi:hypothetical protein
MKKTILTTAFGILITLGGLSTASALVYDPYLGSNTNYIYCSSYSTYGCYNPTYQKSYYYTSGCYTYYYNGMTQQVSVTSYNCQTQQQTSYYPYSSSQYYTYGYNRNNGTWYPRYNNNGGSLYQNQDYYNYYGYNNTNVVYTPVNPCYYSNGYYICQ